MKIVDDIRDYALDSEFKIVIKDNLINILNFDVIEVMDASMIVIKKDNKKVKVSGKSLNINKLLNDEILASGTILSIVFEDKNE